MKTWIFQGNPEVFDIDSYLAASAGLITWRVARYAEHIEPGDTVYIWRSQGDQPQMAGIVAEGTVAEPPRVQLDDPISADFWKEAPEQDELMRVTTPLRLPEPSPAGEPVRFIPTESYSSKPIPPLRRNAFQRPDCASPDYSPSLAGMAQRLDRQ